MNIAVEGPSDVGVARAVIRAAGLVPTEQPYVMNGKGKLDMRVPAFCKAASLGPWLVLRDLDRAPCAGVVVADLAPRRPTLLCFRIAVRSVESWLLADRAHIAEFLGVSADLVPLEPDKAPAAKQTLVRLASRSKRRDIRDDLAPRAGSTAKVGPNYPSRLNEFAEGLWDPRAAARSSPSLARCLAALGKLKHG
ncbi:MAG: hypothetical protein WCC48_06000 [Anaeromyxobacteraceae bacterium]